MYEITESMLSSLESAVSQYSSSGASSTVGDASGCYCHGTCGCSDECTLGCAGNCIEKCASVSRW